MINVYEIVRMLDAAYNCNGRTCRSCKEMFDTQNCPTEEFRESAKSAIQALEMYLDATHDANVPNYATMTEEEFAMLLTGGLYEQRESN